MSDLLSGAIIAICGGLTALAYKKPKEYRRIGGPLAVFSLLWGAVLIGWMFAVGYISAALQPYIDPRKATSAARAVAQLQPDLYFILAITVASFYNAILMWLPDILGRKEG